MAALGTKKNKNGNLGIRDMCPGAMYKAYKKRRKKRRDISGDETEASADEGRADPGMAESEQTASAAEETLGRGTRRAATSTDYGGPKRGPVW